MDVITQFSCLKLNKYVRSDIGTNLIGSVVAELVLIKKIINPFHDLPKIKGEKSNI